MNSRQLTDEMDVMRSVELVLDGGFLLVGLWYATHELAPLPKTYLSEIAFPLDFCLKMLASVVIWMVYSAQIMSWKLSAMQTEPPMWQSSVLLSQASAWFLAWSLLWMEYRRGLTPSRLLRGFWLLKWLVTALCVVFVRYRYFAMATLVTGSPSWSLVLNCTLFGCLSLLAGSTFFESTAITADYVTLPPELHTASVFLPPAPAEYAMPDFKSPVAIPSSRTSNFEAIHISIPTSTTSRWGKNVFVSFKIVVQTQEETWSVRRCTADFVALHQQLPEQVQIHCGALRRDLSVKSQLEKYLQSLLQCPDFPPQTSPALCDFLDMEYVDLNAPPCSNDSEFSLLSLSNDEIM